MQIRHLALPLFAVIGLVLHADPGHSFPYCWGSPECLLSDTHKKSGLTGLFDDEGRLHLFWYEEADSAICHVSRDTSGTWSGPEVVSHTSIASFAVGGDWTDVLHLVWCNTASMGTVGQTSHLFYKTRSAGSWGDSVCVTDDWYNLTEEPERLSAESFADSVPPANWGGGSDNTAFCHFIPSDTAWGTWETSSIGDGHCAFGHRFYGCGRSIAPCHESGCECYLVMPPFCLSEGEKFSFSYRASEPGTAGMRVKGIKRFAPMQPATFTESANSIAGSPDSAKYVAWEDYEITDTVYQRVEFAFPDSMCDMVTFWAFELFSTSDTSMGVCVDSVCVGLSENLRPTLASTACYCAAPAMTLDDDGDVHLIFQRDFWQPEACHCGRQIYYTRRAAASGEWSVPVHVDSSGVGERNYHLGVLHRVAGQARIAVDSNDGVHVAWTDVGGMNEDSILGDDVYYNWRHESDAPGVWRGCVVLSDDGEGGPPDSSKALAPDIVVDEADNVIVVFHGERPDSSRAVPRDTMAVWRQRKESGGNWSSKCTQVPDPDPVQDNTPNCRTPRIALDSEGNMFVAFGWKLTGQKKPPWGSALAQYVAQDEQWTSPSRIISHLRTSTTIQRPVSVWVDSADDVHLAWIETEADTTTLPDTTAIMYMKNLSGWETCVDTPRVAFEDRYVRGLSPHEKFSEGEKTKALELTFSIADTAGCPMPKVGSETFYVALANACDDPSPACNTFDSTLTCSVWNPSFEFWCNREDTLFVADSTDASGEVLIIRENNVSGSARLVLRPYLEGFGEGRVDTIWINSCDHADEKGKTFNVDFNVFATAYNKWVNDSLENWTWDLVHSTTAAYEESCVVDTSTGEKRPTFQVRGPDFSHFATCYGSLFVDTTDCSGE